MSWSCKSRARQAQHLRPVRMYSAATSCNVCVPLRVWRDTRSPHFFVTALFCGPSHHRGTTGDCSALRKFLQQGGNAQFAFKVLRWLELCVDLLRRTVRDGWACCIDGGVSVAQYVLAAYICWKQPDPADLLVTSRCLHTFQRQHFALWACIEA